MSKPNTIKREKSNLKEIPMSRENLWASRRTANANSTEMNPYAERSNEVPRFMHLQERTAGLTKFENERIIKGNKNLYFSPPEDRPAALFTPNPYIEELRKAYNVNVSLQPPEDPKTDNPIFNGISLDMEMLKEVGKTGEAVQEMMEDWDLDWSWNELTQQQKFLTSEGTMKALKYGTGAVNGVSRALTGYKQAKDNYSNNSRYSIEGYINGQAVGDVANLQYGSKTFAEAGCGPISAYNALLALGDSESIQDVSAQFEKDGIMLGATLGTNPLAIEDFFADRGYSTNTVFGADVYKNSAYDKLFKDQTVGVFTCFNNKDNLTKDGAHFVTIVHRPDGRIDVYNYSSYSQALHDYDSIADMIKQNGEMLPISFTTIR